MKSQDIVDAQCFQLQDHRREMTSLHLGHRALEQFPHLRFRIQSVALARPEPSRPPGTLLGRGLGTCAIGREDTCEIGNSMRLSMPLRPFNARSFTKPQSTT
jgi:hypothetical protein